MGAGQLYGATIPAPSAPPSQSCHPSEALQVCFAQHPCSVAPGPIPEIGWQAIWSDRPELVSNGPWFHWHYDRWTVPPGATEIARNPVASQAFVTHKSLAVQFHPELEADGLVGWLELGGTKSATEYGLDPQVMLAMTQAEDPAAEQRTNALVDAYLKDVAGLI